jgi:preprotein translocase subunit SecG
MTALITIIHIIVCIILVVAVLLQSGKSADLAGAFGGAGSQSTFGPRGAQTLLSKATTICAVLFMFTSIGLWLLSSRESGSVFEGQEAPVQEKAAVTTTTSPEEKKAPEKTPPVQPDAKEAQTEAKKKADVPEKK